MAVTNTPLLQSIDKSQLEALGRQILQRETLHLREWQVTQLGGGAGNPVSVGLYRFACLGQDHDEEVAWSVILKGIQSPANVGWSDMGEGDDQTHWNYWKRELFLYQSALHQSLPESLVAPRCFAVTELPGNMALLWLEDIKDAHGGSWSLEHYALTARHLGRLNGQDGAQHLSSPYPWLGDNLTNQWLAQFQPAWESLPWDDPRVLARYPAGNAFQRMLFDHEHFKAQLDGLPRALCHGDTYPTNFMSRSPVTGSVQTVALDWALANVGPLGDDLGQFVFGALANLPHINPSILIDTLFESYLAGLRDSGCQLDSQLVRFGFTTVAALRVGLFQIYLLGEDLKQDNSSPDKPVIQSAVPDCFEVTMARAAYQCLESL